MAPGSPAPLHSVVGEQVFIDLGGIWVERYSLKAYWATSSGSMLLIDGIAISCSMTPSEITEKLMHVALQLSQLPP